ncbi:unnamed protein product [Phytomonas sp. Hart1]|nr:unnamed protein product [Phytomonas sp. Hart1]|eukprot:CCW68834.1 unnamed protein product [Phytomonas sp. isolate Hart1]
MIIGSDGLGFKDPISLHIARGDLAERLVIQRRHRDTHTPCGLETKALDHLVHIPELHEPVVSAGDDQIHKRRSVFGFDNNRKQTGQEIHRGGACGEA